MEAQTVATLEEIHRGKQGKFEVYTENSTYTLDLKRSGGCIASGGILPEPRRGYLEYAKRGDSLVVTFPRKGQLATSEIQRITRVDSLEWVAR